MASYQTVSPEMLKKALAENPGCIVLDVRTDIEHAALSCAAPHLHIPMDRIEPSSFASAQKDKAIYILCQSGGRAAQVAQSLCAAGGCGPIHVVEGGLAACENAGVGIVRNTSVISLERQVRIAAGVLVLAGVTLGWRVDPGFYLLSAAIGGGLIFAGITGACGMALLLAKAPWNAPAKPAPGASQKTGCGKPGGCGCH